jgi:hypothetical protein
MRIFAFFLLTIAIGVNAQSDPKRSANISQLFGTRENLTIVQQPDEVDACFLRYVPAPQGKKRTDERYEETGFVSVPKESVAAITGVLLRDSTYEWELLTGCWPRYSVRLRFRKGDSIVAVDFCFGCKVVAIYRDANFVDAGLWLLEREHGLFRSEMKKLFPTASLR